MKLQVGLKAPEFCLQSHLGKQIRLSELRGKNVVLAFFPLAWTPIWTNQIPSYETEMESFTGLNAQVLGISVDHVPCLQAWAESLGGISYPLLSDFWPHGAVASLYGVLRGGEGISERAIFIIDKEGVIRYMDIHAIDDRPDNEEVRKVLREIQAEEASAAAEAARAEASGVYFGEPVEEAIPQGDIILYCARWCKDCRKAKAWFEDNHLSYVEVDIDQNIAARNQVRQWGGGFLVTPVIHFDGEVILDYNVEKLDAALARRYKDS